MFLNRVMLRIGTVAARDIAPATFCTLVDTFRSHKCVILPQHSMVGLQKPQLPSVRSYSTDHRWTPANVQELVASGTVDRARRPQIGKTLGGIFANYVDNDALWFGRLNDAHLADKIRIEVIHYLTWKSVATHTPDLYARLVTNLSANEIVQARIAREFYRA